MVLNLLTALHQFTLFICYFIYFLFKGKPEWKKQENQTDANDKPHCCLHDQNADACKIFHEQLQAQQQFSSRFNTATAEPQTSDATAESRRNVVKQSQSFAERVKCICRKIGSGIYALIYYLFYLLFWLLKTIFGILIWSPSSKPANDVSENLQSSFNEENLDNLTEAQILADENEFIIKQEPIIPETTEETETINLQSDNNDEQPDSETNIRRRFHYESTDDSIARSSSIPPAPPPPPASSSGAPKFPVWKITVTSSDETPAVESTVEEISTVDANDKKPRGGVAVLPPEITAEASIKVKEREKKLETQDDQQIPLNVSTDEWTVTSSKKIQDIPAQSSQTAPIPAERISRPSNESFPVYKTENMPTRHYRYEQPTVVETTEQSYKHTNEQANDDTFLMGRSVFSPVCEAEELRNSINRKALRSESVSRVESINSHDPFYASPTPYTAYEYTARRSPSTTSFDRTPNTAMSYYTQRSRPQQRTFRNYAYPHTTQQSYNYDSGNRSNGTYVRHRSHTTEPRSSTSVSAISRCWPPRSNATGATVARDIWTMIPQSNVTSCKRTVEKSVTDKWITRVDGRVVDEYSERSWKGESDGMFYRPDGTSEAWYRSLSVNPGGRTTYVNNQSHYNQDFVIQSETRNA